ncbi:carboxypeptidase M32 (plasmid) [Halorubrum salinarum]|uniref:Metal-dependent carboxypeptidase n=1 Tax=Halorubrum salinarum TaxID=2739057 RepID=A0A7D4CUR1_9EURY|nr:carboxypeptidase M32 [Halorubrum salinarum]QKG94359.1 carboxypeptidase M32 [Halorubrum salinarum]
MTGGGPDAYEAFRTRVERLTNVSHASRLLDWDQQVMMPDGGTTARSSQLAALSGLEHDLLCDRELGQLLDDLEGADLDPVEAANVREIRRRHDRSVKVPASLVERTRQARSDAFDVWNAAKADDDFSAFADTLAELVELRREYADHLAPDRDPYRVLYEEFEPYLPYDRMVDVLDTLRAALPPLIDAIRDSDVTLSKRALSGTFDPSRQEAFVRELLTDLGYDWERGRLDTAAHPFQRGSQFDARIGTRFDESDLLDGVTSTVHEFGHALYVQNLPDEQYGMPTGEARDMSIHESQSRFWENHVARSRPFWERTLPLAREQFDSLAGVSADEMYRAANVVDPENVIRVEADELTYHLHIVVRFEIERALVRGELEAEEVPAVWNDKYEEYLGVRPKTDAEGCLQDVHWSNATFGYFPTYSLGSVAAAQFRSAFEADVGALPEVLSAEGFDPVADWLREHVHRHGKRYRTDDLIKTATGEPLTADHYVSTVEAKYTDLYDL